MAAGTKLVKTRNFWRTRPAGFHNVTEIYKPAVIRNKEKIIELIQEKAAQATKSELAKKIHVAKGFYTVEVAPPSSAERNEGRVCGDFIYAGLLFCGEKLRADIALVKDFIKSGCYKYLTVKQAWLLFLVGTEVGLWFYLGETIGKMHIVGYQV